MNPIMHGVWFTEQAQVAGTAYHMALGVRLDGDLDRHALGEACAAVVARHPVLSSAVTLAGDLPELVPAAEKVTLTDAPYSEQRVREEIERPYDLARGPLARFLLLRETPTRHLLLFTAHHLVFDGMSKDLLLADLAAAYAGTELAPLPAATDGAPGEQAVAAARAYWTDQAVSPGEVVLPDLTGVPTAAEAGHAVEIELPTVDVAGLTRFEVLLAAIHVLLARYGNTGLPVAIGLSTRTEHTARHIGLHVNELPVAVAPAAGRFRDYATALRSRLRDLYRHRAVPLAQVSGGLRAAPSLTAVSVGYRRRGPAPEFPGLAAEVQWALFGGSARNALHLQFVDGPDGLTASLQHDPARLPVAAARRIGEHLRTVLAAVAADPDADVATLPIMPAAEADTVLHRWNDTARPRRESLVRLLATQTGLHPDETAVVDGDVRLSYAELDRAVTALAARLPGEGALVAVRLPRGWQALVAMLAVLRAGAAYVPVDPSYPQARQELILADADPALILDGLDAVPQARPGGAVPAGTAYVMYTSGTTGRPKGVVVPHSALANLLLGMAEAVGSRPGDRWLGLTPLSFDISGLELFLPLVTGGRLVIASDLSALEGRAVAALIAREGVTHVQATPSGWQVLLEAGFDGPAVTALAGGEALPPDLARRLRARTARLINVYGPTETTIWSTADEIPEQPDTVTIGRPIANTRTYVLDPAGRPLPAGVWGELCIGGDGVADGYLRRPDLTAERFVPDPFGPGRLYRTGDRCRWTADGRLVYGGRDDGQVKIRGHRVELEEIEAHLREHPGVAQAAVTLRGGELAGYLVPRDTAPDAAELRRHLGQRLPAATVPTSWTVLDRLPLTPSGKLDRAALPEPVLSRTPAPVRDARASGDDELVETLRAIWQEVLSVEDVGDDEDLFDLGGHSLTITRISVRITQQLGRDVPLDVFFDTPTIAEIAQYLREQP